MTDTITLPREVVERLVATWDWDAETLIGHRMKIMSELVDNLRTALAAEPTKPEPVATVGTQSNAAWKGYDGRWSPPGDPIKVVHLLRDLPLGTLLYAAPPDAPTVKESLTHSEDIETLRRDAERYRYLRNRDPKEVFKKSGKAAGVWIDWEDDSSGLQLLTGDDADAAIDAAMEGKR